MVFAEKRIEKTDALDIKSCAQATHLLDVTSNPMHRHGVFSIEFKSVAQAWCFIDFMMIFGQKKPSKIKSAAQARCLLDPKSRPK